MPHAEDDTVLGTMVGVGVPPKREDQHPELVANRYRIVRWLGGGGMGRVYEAIDTELDERIALKMLRAGLSDDAIERFRREVRLTRRIQHRNVARMFDIGEHAGDKFLTMELVDGESLAQRVGPPMAWAELAPLAEQICAGLEAAHAAGVVHRDLKPDNVLVETATGRAVITDFGIARGADDAQVTQTGMVVGTPRYMAPEQLAGGDLDGRADVFSLGVMLYELASGTRPWSGDNAVAIAVAQATKPPRPLRAAVPPSIGALIETCIATERDARPASVASVAAAIRAAGTIAAGTPPPMPARAPDAATSSGIVPVAPVARAATTIAVVPFRSAPEDANLALSVREDLIDLLSTTPGVLARPAFTMTEAEDPRATGARLGVDVVVVGAVRRLPSGVRVAARLVGVADGFQIGAHHADGSDAEVLALTDRVGRAIADALSARATPCQRPMDSRAVALYLEARAELRRFWAEHTKKAAELLERALAIEPHSPQLLGSYASTTASLWAREGTGPALERAQRAAERARAAHHAEGVLASGILRINQGDVEGAVVDFAHTLMRAPMLGSAHEFVGRVLVEVSETDDGRRHLETAVALDPGREQMIDLDLCRLDGLFGQWASADQRIARLLAHSEDAFRFMGKMAHSRLASWRRDIDGLRLASRSIQLAKDPTGIARVMFTYLDGSRDPGMMFQLVEQLGDAARPRRTTLVGLQRTAEMACTFDFTEPAIAAIARADELGLVDIVWLDRCPSFDAVRAHPRHAELRASIAARAARVLAAYHAATT